MSLQENRLLAEQIQLLYFYNRYKAKDPFDLHIVNCNESHQSTKSLISRLKDICFRTDFYTKFNTESYLDLFPKEKLVYLSPDSDQVLNEYNVDDIYIIGGIVDKRQHQPATYMKARQDGIRSARLPIDEHVLWAQGAKYLCLNHVIAILHDVSISGDWRSALRDNIPKRKQKQIEDIYYEDMLRKQKMLRFKRYADKERKNTNKILH